MNAKTFGAAVLIAGMLGFCAWVWFVRQPAPSTRDGAPASDTTALTSPVEADELEARTYDTGDCVSWSTSIDASDTDVVDCNTPHLFQVAGSIDAREVDGIGRDYPGDDAWSIIADRDCRPVVETHLGAPLDPNGRWSIGTIHPTPQSWDVGRRTVWCGITASDVDGTAVDDEFVPMTGRADPAAQVVAMPPGQCRAFQPDGDTSPVGCEQPHQIEVAGLARLADGPAYPGDEAVLAACSQLARAYTPAAVSYAPWRFDERSWAAGTREVNCVVGDAGGVNGWGTRTGSLAAVPS